MLGNLKADDIEKAGYTFDSYWQARKAVADELTEAAREMAMRNISFGSSCRVIAYDSIMENLMRASEDYAQNRNPENAADVDKHWEYLVAHARHSLQQEGEKSTKIYQR